MKVSDTCEWRGVKWVNKMKFDRNALLGPRVGFKTYDELWWKQTDRSKMMNERYPTAPDRIWAGCYVGPSVYIGEVSEVHLKDVIFAWRT